MKMKALFSVPEGQKITEKQLHRVLLTSICSILLCMCCLAGSTWAWFVASVESTGNVIEIAEPKVLLKVEGAEAEGTTGITLSCNSCTVLIEHGNKSDIFEQKSTLYVVVTVQSGEKTIVGYTVLNGDNAYKTEVSILNESKAEFTVCAKAYWMLNGNFELLSKDVPIEITADYDNGGAATEKDPEDSSDSISGE